ncbi:hypothetical protein ASPBRDRAFT_200014 [Aspergillus brasiliensis CBS 101740]|uniref:F-box domain-containing protein n=1 Tax=Aspergillus brasiliensis (strain CBS 101740 / IMI 381727 / IBT 21946) TaxID=767769 RepID=A0A1L9U6H9_ASPBC|nr:hypothetical protein ASPBRDRAFT_200014 [Aspergillus brasiliensis CBS 101740]
MDRLPVELKCLVAGAVSDVSRDALQALSQVNHQWNQIAASRLYRNMTVFIKTIRPQDRPFEDESVGNYLERSLPEDVNVPLQDRLDGIWTPAIVLVKRLACLQQMNILAFSDYTKVLDVVAEAHPYCHVSVFPLYLDKPYQILEPSKWIHSPVLNAVTVISLEDYHLGVFTDHPDRILRDFLRQAPHIKRLSLQISQKSLKDTYSHYIRWLATQPVESENNQEIPPAKLEMLSLPLITELTAESVKRWSWVTDLGYLTAWAAGAIRDMTVMTTIAELQPFRALKRLTLTINPTEKSPSWPSAIKAMFNALLPLVCLYLLGTYDPRILPTAVLDRHGPTLTELRLHYRRTQFQQGYEAFRLLQKGQIAPIFTAEVISRIAARCPVLRTLRICVQRYRGYSIETQAYEALAQFPVLQTLDLVLKCQPIMQRNGTPFPPRKLSADERELVSTPWRDIPKWVIRDSTINSAIDESLATAIFNRIRMGRPGRRLLCPL